MDRFTLPLTLCAASLAFTVTAGRVVTPLSGGGWTCDGAPVSVPHTWNAVDGCDGGVNPSGTFTSCRATSYVRKAATYRRALPNPTRGKRQFVKCEAVSIKATLRVNGREVGRHRGAFTAFCFEVTDFLKPSGNVIEIVADNTLDEDVHPIVGDFTMYGGVYRDVWFVETDPVCIDLVSDGADGVVLEPDVATGDVVARVAVLGGTNEVQRFHFDAPKLWTPETPHLYAVTVTVEQKGSSDSVTIPFGFRTLRFDDTGFYLNGVKRKFHGACRHQDREGKGWAVSRQDEVDDVRMMKTMGCDAVRTSHYPQSEGFLDVCDRLGLMVWCETALVNEITFSEAFHANMLDQAREMIAQRRNHPSVVVWGLFNEIYSGSKHKAGTIEVYLRELKDQMHRQDPTRKVVCASNQYGRRELSQVPDFCGFNIYAGWYEFEPWYRRCLDRTGAMTRDLVGLLCRTNALASLGIGEYGAGGSVFRHNDPFNVQPYDEHDDSEEYQAAFHYCNYGALRDDPRVWGTFIWEMFDSGADLQHEPGRWGCNTKGLVEFDHRMPKDAFYFYKANWNPEPMLHLVGSRRTFWTNAVTTVLGFCNAGDVTLTVNGLVVGTKAPDDRKAVIWDGVVLRPGRNEIVLTCGGLRAASELTAPTTVRIAADDPDVSAAFRKAVRALGPSGGTVVFAPGEYRIPVSAGEEMRFFISNHDQSDVHRVVFPIVGTTNVTVEATGALFVFDGKPIPFAVIDSVGVTLRGFGIDSSVPFMPELTIAGFSGRKTIARLDPAVSPHRIEDGRLHFMGDGWDFVATHAKLFDGQTRELVERSGDVRYSGVASELEDGLLELDYDFSSCGRGAKVGDVVVLRPGPRPCPAVFVYRSKDVALQDVAVHSALGMALLTQRSEDVRWLGTADPETRKSGVFPRRETGRYASAHADATHFSNVAGEVCVERCLFEGMMDDAMNVHSTCLYVTNVVNERVLHCRYMHEQSVGFEVFRPYEKLRFIAGDTLETGPEFVVADVKRLNDREILVCLDRPIPEGWGVGDAVENADYQCAAIFRQNIVRFNRARGTLFTTPKPVLVESNLFDRVTGSAILFAGDAHYWFESGACRDVTVKSNVFRNCLTCYGSHQFSNGVISFYPMIHNIDRQQTRYHGNVRIEGNVFESFDVPLLYARSVDGLVFRDNKVVPMVGYRGVGMPAFVTEYCRQVEIKRD